MVGYYLTASTSLTSLSFLAYDTSVKVFVTGGTGYVGRSLVDKLVHAGHQVTLLVRQGSEKKISVGPIQISCGDALDLASLKAGLQGQEAVIHLVGIIREFPRRGITFQRLHVEATRSIVEATKAQGIRRYLHMSALGTRTNPVSRYHQTKYQAEEIVRASGLDYTIFRPSVIFGKEDAFVNLFAGMIRKSPLVPLIVRRKSVAHSGDTLSLSKGKLQPISVEDVAEGFVRALATPETIGQTYELGGPRPYSLGELLDIIARVMNRKILKIPVPIWYMRFLARCFEYFPWFPVSRDQLIMLQEDNVCDPTRFAETFGISLTPFEEGIRAYLR